MAYIEKSTFSRIIIIKSTKFFSPKKKLSTIKITHLSIVLSFKFIFAHNNLQNPYIPTYIPLTFSTNQTAKEKKSHTHTSTCSYPKNRIYQFIDVNHSLYLYYTYPSLSDPLHRPRPRSRAFAQLSSR